jgi:hypothetical protein
VLVCVCLIYYLLKEEEKRGRGWEGIIGSDAGEAR